MSFTHINVHRHLDELIIDSDSQYRDDFSKQIYHALTTKKWVELQRDDDVPKHENADSCLVVWNMNFMNFHIYTYIHTYME